MKYCMLLVYLRFQTSVTEMLYDGYDEPKHETQCRVALKCCVWLHTSFVFQLSEREPNLQK